MGHCCCQVRRYSSASPRVCVFASTCLVLNSICVSTFVTRTLLSLFIVDKVPRCSRVIASSIFPYRGFFSTMLSACRHLPPMLFVLACFLLLPPVPRVACSVGSVVVVPVPPMSWSDRSMVSFLLDVVLLVCSSCRKLFALMCNALQLLQNSRFRLDQVHGLVSMHPEAELICPGHIRAL